MKPRAPLPSAILETCLHVSDLARTRDFYTGLFGYPVMKSDERFCALSIGDRQVLILFRRGSDPDGTTLPFGFIPAQAAVSRTSASVFRKRVSRPGE